MRGSNDGQSMQLWPSGRVAGQDRKGFSSRTSRAVPAPGYFADARGLVNEQVIKDAIAGLSDPKEIEDTLAELLRSRSQAQDFMWWRLKMRK
jgi:hypothetical protein